MSFDNNKLLETTTLNKHIKNKNKYIRHMWESSRLEGYSSSFHTHNIFKTSRKLISDSGRVVSLNHWCIRTDSNNNQYASGYLANGCYWVTSSILEFSFSWDEFNLGHFRVETKNTTYCLSYTDAAFSTQYFNIVKNARNIDHEKFYDINNSIYINNWRIVDKGYDYNYKYHLRGTTTNYNLNCAVIDSAQIESVVLKYDKFDEGNYEDPVLLFKTVNDFTFMTLPYEKKWPREYMVL